MPAPKVKVASIDDLPELLRLFHDSSKPMYARLGATEADLDRWEVSTDWEEYWQWRVAQGRVLIAKAGDAFVGMLGIIPVDAATAGLVSIYTRESGQGTGSALMKAALELAPKLGVSNLELLTGAKNPEMRALAEKFGFENVEQVERPEFKGVPFLRYVRKL